jgi:hypothetical protein
MSALSVDAGEWLGANLGGLTLLFDQKTVVADLEGG